MSDTQEQSKLDDENDNEKDLPNEKEEPKERIVLFKDSIKIYPDKKLPHLNRGSLQAYKAESNSDENLFALVCEKSLVPRISKVSPYTGMKTSYMPDLVGSGPAYWAEDKRQVYVFIYKNIYGDKLLQPSRPHALGLKESIVAKTLIPSLVELALSLDSLQIVHSGISLDALYTDKPGTGIMDSKYVTVAECLSLPAFSVQNATYLPIEKCFADTVACGEGHVSDDLYALGATLACAIRKKDPLEGKTRREIGEIKLEEGSFQAIMGAERLSGHLLDLVRGLLTDDPYQRWTLEDVRMWQDGHRISVKQTQFKRYKAKRPVEFVGNKYLRPGFLAADMSANTVSAMKIVEDDTLEKWVSRAIGDPVLKGKMEKAEEKAGELREAKEISAIKTSFYTSALADTFPLFYKSTSFFPDGFGKLLVNSYLEGRDTEAFIDFIKTKLMTFWVDNTRLPEMESTDVLNQLRVSVSSLKQPGLGYGTERVFYLLCDEAPCLSKAYQNYYIRSPDDVYYAFDDLCLKGKAPAQPIDRHVAAFLSVQDRNVIDPYLVDLNSQDPRIRTPAILKTFATLQSRGKLEPAEGITAWIVDHVGQTVIDTYYNREHRQKLSEKFRKLKHSGNVVELVGLLDNPYERGKDLKDFANAQRHYKEVGTDIKFLEKVLKEAISMGAYKGRETAALLASLVGAGMIFLTLLSRFAGVEIF